jgi:hypothetical protein
MPLTKGTPSPISRDPEIGVVILPFNPHILTPLPRSLEETICFDSIKIAE